MLKESKREKPPKKKKRNSTNYIKENEITITVN